MPLPSIPTASAAYWHARLLHKASQLTMDPLHSRGDDVPNTEAQITEIRSRIAEDIGHIILAAYSDGCTVQIIPNDTEYVS